MLGGVSKLAKLLASDKVKTRKLGYKYVRELLSLEPGSDQFNMSFKDMLGVCKGLYYSLWMQDKLLLQEEAAERIAKLISTTKSRGLRSMYIKAMFETLAREWDNLDTWREDKFMMLVRVFFVRCIGSVTKRKVSVETLVNAVFGNVINTSTNSAIGLKLHLCLVIQQELLDAGEIPTVIHLFFKHTIETLQSIPRGSAYASELIKLVLFLTRQMRRYSKLPLDKISDELLVSSTEIVTHRKTLRRIALMLHTKKSRINDQRRNFYENPAVSNDADATPVVAPSINTTTPTKKRRLQDFLENFEGSSNVSARHRKRRKTVDLGDEEGSPSILPCREPDSQRTAIADVDVREDVFAAASSAMNGEPASVTTKPEFDLSVMDQTSPIREKKRVSFGKVVCKRFSTRRVLSAKRITQTEPDRSILRH
ncbi:ribosomal RNA processing protein 1 [Echinococcus multilocularis]|uniref:Ribosomal RNA processing protein 1 n=1 Tax=Echinococcus multilocularis TaxID=6211 RepID=A0A068YF60_ECHMU|nr:ribosomal RNA processing protein 1 [Echinococcus multilocularis]